MPTRRSVLIIEDTIRLAELYVSQLVPLGVKTEVAHNGEVGLERVKHLRPAVILLDIQLPGIDGFEVLRRLARESNPAVVIVMTAHSTINTAVEAMKLGANDFLVKPFDAERLRVTVANALERSTLGQIVEEIQQGARRSYHDFVGASLPMQAVYRTIDASAPSKASVFITGESGTGKELCAEAIHKQGPRRNASFIAINCGAIPRDLMETEMFGHKRGSFTGAVSDRVGAAEMADGGTLFLDEIGEMDIGLQAKLLRFVQTGVFYRIGEDTPRKVNTRFIAATNADPLDAVADGRLREDLYYRLNVIPIDMPPLRERFEDVALIAETLLRKFAAEEGKSFRAFTREVLEVLRAYHWPGNVRQLQNVIRNTVVLNEGDAVTVDMLPAPLSEYATTATTNPPVRVAGNPRPSGSDSDILPLREVEREAVERAIALCGGNIPRAAAALDVAPSTLYRKRLAWTETN